MLSQLYIVKSDGEPLYGRSFQEGSIVDLNSVPLFVRNSVALFHSRSSISSERVYTLEHDESIWFYAFFRSFVLVAVSDKHENLVSLKNVIHSIGRSIAMKFGDIFVSWGGSLSEIIDINELIDLYITVNLEPPQGKILKKIEKQINKALSKPEIAFAGVFDASGKMIQGNLPATHLFRIEIEISQGTIKPVIDIVPTSVNSGDYKLQMLRVNSLTVVIASQVNESHLRAIAVAGEIAHTLYELM
jgi:hypothetical protein